MKAYALASLKIGKKTHKASTDDEPTVVELSDKEFKRLEGMGAVRTPTDKELKLAAVEEAEVVEETAPKNTAPKGGKQAAAGASTGTKNPAGGDTNLDI